jgi:hypothetical protein
MVHGAMARQGVGPGNGLRELDDIEAEAHQCSDGAATLWQGRWGSSGSGSGSGEAPGPAHEDGKRVRRLGTNDVARTKREDDGIALARCAAHGRGQTA